MQIIVHRGTHEIGGCCTEIKTNQARILIDFGSVLTGENRSLTIPRFDECDAVFITHYHGDHIGELANVPDTVPIFMGSTAKKIEEAYCEHMGPEYLNGFNLSRVIELADNETICIKDMQISVIPSDHSACGSYMYLIKSAGKTVLHTGDYRLHGPRKDKLLKTLFALGNIDVLISEGTSVERKDPESYDEKTIEALLIKIMKKHKYCFVLCSSGNIDRIASAASAVPRGKYFLVDGFQKKLLQIATEQEQEYTGVFRKALVIGENIKERMKQRGFCMIVRANNRMRDWVKSFQSEFPDETCIVYSMWTGYLENAALKDFCSLTPNFYIAHTSGHVILQDMNEMINRLNPKRILFIHTESKKDAIGIDLKDRIIDINDGEVFTL